MREIAPRAPEGGMPKKSKAAKRLLTKPPPSKAKRKIVVTRKRVMAIDKGKTEEPTRGVPEHQPSVQEQHQGQGAPATPGKAQPDTQPANQPADAKKPEEKVLPKEEAKSLLHGGHRLKKKGADPEKWMSTARVRNTLCLAVPLDEETEKKVLADDLVLIPE